jgi:hypothetical protein
LIGSCIRMNFLKSKNTIKQIEKYDGTLIFDLSDYKGILLL